MAYYECTGGASDITNLLLDAALPENSNYTVSTNLSGKSVLICLFTFTWDDIYYRGNCYKAVYMDITNGENLGISYEAHLIVTGGYTGVYITPSSSKIVFKAYVHDKALILNRVIVI